MDRVAKLSVLARKAAAQYLWLDSSRDRRAADEWTYHNVTVEEGTGGSGKKEFVVQGEKRAKGKRTQYINEKFNTRKEAENWVKHAMPGAKIR